MRLLHVVPTYAPAYRYGGPIYSVHGLCRGLAERGHEVHVYTTNVDGPGDSAVPLGQAVDIDGVQVWYYPSRWLRRLYYSPPLQRALVANIAGFDALHLHSVFLWPTLVAARAAERAGVPYLLAPRGMLVKDLVRRKNALVKSLWLRLFERHTLEHAAALHLTSPTETRELAEFGYRLPRLCEVPNGIDTPAASATQPPREHDHIVFLGRVNWKKGLDRVLPALNYVPRARLTIAGNDEENYRARLQPLLEQYRLQQRVEFIGPVQGEAKEALLRQATLLVLPSYNENFGNVVLEAMARRCPVLVTPEVGAAGLVADSGAGLVCAGEPEILGARLNELLRDPELRQRMGERGEAAVREHYTWAAVAVRMEQVYQDILEDKSKP